MVKFNMQLDWKMLEDPCCRYCILMQTFPLHLGCQEQVLTEHAEEDSSPPRAAVPVLKSLAAALLDSVWTATTSWSGRSDDGQSRGGRGAELKQRLVWFRGVAALHPPAASID